MRIVGELITSWAIKKKSVFSAVIYFRQRKVYMYISQRRIRACAMRWIDAEGWTSLLCLWLLLGEIGAWGPDRLWWLWDGDKVWQQMLDFQPGIFHRAPASCGPLSVRTRDFRRPHRLTSAILNQDEIIKTWCSFRLSNCYWIKWLKLWK